MDPGIVQGIGLLLLTAFGSVILWLVLRVLLKVAEANESWWDYSDEELNRYAEDESELLDERG